MSKAEIAKFLMQGTSQENLPQIKRMEVLMLLQFGLY